MSSAPSAPAGIAENGVALMPVTIGGVTLPVGSTPEQRFAAQLKASGVQVPAPDARKGFGPPLHVHAHSAGGVAEAGTVGGKASPPSPAALEAANKPAPPQGNPSAAREAEFDAEMQAKGLQRRPDGSTHAEGAADPEVIEKLTARYRQLHKALISRQEPGEDRAEREADLRGAYERDLKRAHEGRPLKEFETKLEMPKAKPAAQPVSQHPPEAWAEAHVSVADKEGWVPFERINKDGLSGYTLPNLIEGQTYHVSIFQDLANARKQGITQKQVEGFIRAGMVSAGWLKA